MSDIIRLLPDSIANQIAAGEVVQRPASVVKELLENAVDAGAAKVKVIIQEAGRQLIQVVDDGKGMSPADVRLSIERHATSKITASEDLFALRTMGFRGEALASIAAVAQVEIRTRRPEDETGTILAVDASTVRRQEPEACQPGTSVTVRNLFFNVPARRNFLKSNPVELRHVLEEFTRMALARPELALMLVNGDEVLFDLQPARLGQRIVAVFGKNYQQQLAALEDDAGSIAVHGYVGRPELARRTRSEQFIFVNNRYIRNAYLHHAVLSGFEGLLPEGTYPFYVLFINIDPKHIDVNVHPAKTEIKFTDERAVYALVRVAVRKALGVHQFSPAIDFSADVNLGERLQQSPASAIETVRQELMGDHRQQNNLRHWETLMDTGNPQQGLNLPVSETPVERVMFQFQDQFIIREVSNGLMVINQQAAHERVLFDRYLSALSGNNSASQQLLFPLTLDFSAADATLVQSMLNELGQLGFRLEPFGKQNFLLNGAPPETASREREVLEGLLEQFKSNRDQLRLDLRENLARSLARRAAIRQGQRLTRDELEAIVRGLFSSSSPSLTPEGRPTFFIFETGQMTGFFN